MIHVIMSGGQTGADRAALDFAIAAGVVHDGWCPKGRLAEDGPIPDKYKLTETSSEKYPPRTEKNVKHSDATIIFNQRHPIEAGCALTERLCVKHNKPYLLLNGSSVSVNVKSINNFLEQHPEITKLNIAGNRESKAPGIHDHVYLVLCTLPRELFAVHRSVADIL